MRVLITGGAGFIGSHIADSALASGHEVAVLDNLSTGRRENVPQAARFFEVDLRDAEGVKRALSEFKPEVVSHQAAQASVAISVREPKFDVEVNIIGGLNLLDACCEASVKRVVFASTGGAIYGEVPEGTTASEDKRPLPISPYAISKLAFEQLLSVYETHRGLPSTVLRYGNVYGPRQDPHGEAGVVAIFLRTLLTGSPIRVFARKTVGDSGCVRDYVYVSDVAKMNMLVLSGEIEDKVVNVGTGVGTSTLDLAKLLAQSVSKDPEIQFGPWRAGDLERSVLDATKVVQKLGKLVDLKTGLAETGAWFAANIGKK